MNIKINIPNNVNELIHTLQTNGYSAYVVGGCVRDSILGRKPHDWDVCTSATPEEMLEIFKDKRIIETGLQHGTVTVISNGEPIEITTYRIDGDYSDGRHPDSVKFTSDLIEDLSRRDFTINAMAYNDKDGLIDPFDGLDDIKHKKINCVGRAEDRFNEDGLRILRAIRFAAQLGFLMESNTKWQIHKQKDNLKNISMERINSEFCKIAATDMFCVKLLLYPDVFSLFIPELDCMIDFMQQNPNHMYNSVFSHTIHALDKCNSDDLIVRLAVFFHDFGKPHSYQENNGIREFNGHSEVGANIVDTIMRRLKFDNNTREKVVELVRYHADHIEANKKDIKLWLNKIGIEQFKRLLEVVKADNKAKKLMCSNEALNRICLIENILEEILNNNECFSLKDLAVSGNDLISIGYKPGKGIGNTLNKLLKMVIDEDIENDKYILLRFAET